MPDRRTWVLFAVLGTLAAALIVVTLAVPAGADHRVLRTLLPLGLGGGIAAGVLVGLVARRARRRRGVVLPLAGLGVGLAVGFGVDLWRSRTPSGHSSAEVVYHGRYVPMDGVTMAKAYSSTLTVTSVVPVSWWSLLLTGGAAGLGAGALVWALDRVLRARTASTPG